MLQRHRTFYILCVLMSHRLAIDAAYHVKTHCELGLCLVLYGSENMNGITYGLSRGACSEQSMEAAPITDPSVQQMIPTLLSAFDMVNNTAGDAWTAGLRQNADNEWKYLDGTIFEEPSHIEDVDQQSGNCAFLERLHAGHRLVADQCDETNGDQYPFCYFAKTDLDSCSSARHFMYKGMCYYVHNEEYGDGGWYDAQNYCHIELGGDLAYKHILDTELIDTLKQRGVSNNLWTGITRHQWRWLTHIRDFRMRYFNWGSTFDESITDTRVAISSGDFTWRMYNSPTRLNYFICSHEDASYTTTETTTATIATTTTEQPTSIGDTSSVDRNSEPFPVAAVAGSVSAISVVAIVVAVVVVLFMRRQKEEKQQPKTSHIYANEGVGRTKPAGSSENHEPELDYEDVQGDLIEADYSSVGLGQADNTDQITPYGEYKPPAAKESSTKNRISGFFQKARLKPQAKNKDDEIHEIAIYSQPIKPKKRKNTMDATTAKTKPTTKTGNPKGNTKKSPKPEVVHVEAPSGDVYAVATKTIGTNDQTSEVLDLL